MSHQVTLYVKSKKTKVEDGQVGRQKTVVARKVPLWGAGNASTTFQYYDVDNITHYDYVLPEDQQRMLKDVKELGLKYGFDVEVVDLEKMNAFSRFELEHSKKIKTFPSMVTDYGETFEGIMTKEQIETYFSKTAKGE